VTLPAFVAERRLLLHGPPEGRAVQQSIDTCCVPAGRSAANPPLHAAAATSRWDRQIDPVPD